MSWMLRLATPGEVLGQTTLPTQDHLSSTPLELDEPWAPLEEVSSVENELAPLEAGSALDEDSALLDEDSALLDEDVALLESSNVLEDPSALVDEPALLEDVPALEEDWTLLAVTTPLLERAVCADELVVLPASCSPDVPPSSSRVGFGHPARTRQPRTALNLTDHLLMLRKPWLAHLGPLVRSGCDGTIGAPAPGGDMPSMTSCAYCSFKVYFSFSFGFTLKDRPQ